MNDSWNDSEFDDESLLAPFGTHTRWRSLIQLAVTEMQIHFPQEFRQKSGRVVMALAISPTGLPTETLVRTLNPDFDHSSAQKQSCMVVNLYKLIQRTRKKLRAVALDIETSRALGTFRLIPCSPAS